MIYLIRNARTLSVKIGFSSSPKQRLAALQTAHEDKLDLVLVVPEWGARHESELHNELRAVRRRGEWFVESQEISDLEWELRSGTHRLFSSPPSTSTTPRGSDPDRLSAALRSYRADHCLTQHGLSDQSGVPRSTIANLEGAKHINPTTSVLKRLEDATGLDLWSLLRERIS